MFEAIVTIVVPDSRTKNEPAHTKVARYEFETEQDLENGLASLEAYSVSAEQLLAGFHKAAGG